RRRAGADNRLRDRDRDDRQSRHGRAVDGSRADRTFRLADGLRGGDLSRARKRLCRTGDASRCGGGKMSRFWSSLTHELKPYVPGEQPRMADLVKLNTNENPLGPSPRALAAIRDAAADTLRLYPDPQATALREALATYHGVRPEQVFVGNGSDEVLAHAFVALLKHDAPLLFPDITYSFYPVYCRLFGIAYETVPLDQAMQIRAADYRRQPGAIIIPNPNAPTGIALSRAEITTLLDAHPDVPVVVDEAYVDFGAETAIPLVATHRNLLV